MKIYLACFLILFFSKGFSQDEKLKSFSISECLNNCELQSQIESGLENNELVLSGIIKLNCCGKFIGSFELIGSDTLNIIVENDQNDTRRAQSCDCFCTYSINMLIRDCIVTPTVVLINGETFKENDKKGGIQKDIDLK